MQTSGLARSQNAGVYNINNAKYCLPYCKKLIEMLHNVLATTQNEDLRGKPAYAHNLTYKFLNHAYTILALIQYEHELKRISSPIKISVLPSIQVLVRASFEAYLTFYYVFTAPLTTEEKEYRYLAYVYSGYFERSIIPFADRFTGKDRNGTERFKRKLKANNYFQLLGQKKQKEILKGEWKCESWHKISTQAGFTDQIFAIFYKYLCGYAHSGSLSVRQSSQILINGQPFDSIDSLLLLLNKCIAKIITEYGIMFTKSLDCLNAQDKAFITLWAQV
jgi:hypothetical protein